MTSGSPLVASGGVADCEHGTWTLRDTGPEFVGCEVVPKALHAQLGLTCTPFGTSTTGPTSDGDPGASNPPCTPQPCAVGSDGVAVSLSQIRHVTSANGEPVLEFDLRVVNGSPWELGIGPEAYVQLVLTDGSKVDMGPDDGPQALGRAECYGNPFMSGTDTEIYHLRPGESLTVPKPLCFALDPNQAPVESVSFNDENGPGPEVVRIAGIR